MKKLNAWYPNLGHHQLWVSHLGTPVQHLFGGYQAFAFTEQGVAMLSSVLKSKRAVYVNIMIMRAFVKLCQIFAAIRQLMTPPVRKKKKIGFLAEK